MAEFIILMHADTTRSPDPSAWDRYFERLNQLGVFEGGSAIGAGASFRQSGDPAPLSEQLTGYIRVRAGSFDEARALVQGNPVYESGGTVEVRALPRG